MDLSALTFLNEISDTKVWELTVLIHFVCVLSSEDAHKKPKEEAFLSESSASVLQDACLENSRMKISKVLPAAFQYSIPRQIYHHEVAQVSNWWQTDSLSLRSKSNRCPHTKTYKREASGQSQTCGIREESVAKPGLWTPLYLRE